jgi:tetratricopeptide (TPR) repeat protein
MIRLNQSRSAARRTAVSVALLLLALTARVSAQESNGPALLPDVSDAGTNGVSNQRLERLKFALSTARFAASTRDYPTAEQNYLLLLAEDVPDDLEKTALFELGVTVQAENDLPRAQSIFTQYSQRWSGDVRLPEVCLHQGQVFRAMGMNQLALVKFYGVMTTALSMKPEQMAYYQRLVLQAQVEIAETHYLVGKYAEAAEYYGRLLQQGAPELDLAEIQFRLVRSLVALNRHAEAATQAQDFLLRHADSPEEPEMRYYLAQALKGEDRNSDALEQVMIFLKEERAKTQDHPEVWTYWQQRVGNEIGNQLYQEGDYVKALEVYQTLAKLDESPAWQMPVTYQVGITYEKLLQPENAMTAYRAITNAAPSLGTNVSPGLQSVADMAQWRLNFLQFQERAEGFTRPKSLDGTNLDLSKQ